MSNPFSDLQQALANGTGIDFVLCGIILGIVVTVAFMIMLVWTLDPKSKGLDNGTMMVSGSIGILFSVAVGWFPSWMAVFIIFIIAFIMIFPSGRK